MKKTNLKFLLKFMLISAAVITVEEAIDKENMWKKNELEKLSKMVQNKIHSIQVSNFYK